MLNELKFVKSQLMEYLPELFARAFLYASPLDGESVPRVIGSGQPLNAGWEFVIQVACFQALVCYLYGFMSRKEFTKKQVGQFLLFGIPALILAMSEFQWELYASVRTTGWVWLGGAALLFMGFRHHLEVDPLAPKEDRPSEAEQIKEGKAREEAGTPLWFKLIFASLIALPALPLSGLAYGGMVMVLLCIFRVQSRRAWLIGLFVSVPYLTYGIVDKGIDFFGGPSLSTAPWVLILTYLLVAGLAFAGALAIQKLFVMGRDRQLAFLQMLPAMAVLMYSAHMQKRHVFSDLPVMGTGAKLVVWGGDDEAKASLKEMMAIYDDINEKLSLYVPESELNRMNREASKQEFLCSDLLWDNLMLSREMYQLSEGYFDVTVGPLMNLWGFYAKKGEAPSEQEIDEVMKHTGFDKLIFNEKMKTVKFSVPGMVVDFGGITKGYAVDEVCEMLMARGHERGLVDLGGNIRVLKTAPPEMKDYPLGLRHPRKQGIEMGEVRLLDNAISTSGNYERYVTYKGVRYPHIINPHTGRPHMGVDSVSIVSSEAVYADGLSTALFVGGPRLVEKVLQRFPDMGILMVKWDEKNELETLKLGEVFTSTELDLEQANKEQGE